MGLKQLIARKFYKFTAPLKPIEVSGLESWNFTTTYNTTSSQFVEYTSSGVSRIYKSLEDNNLNHFPTDISWWVEVSPSEATGHLQNTDYKILSSASSSIPIFQPVFNSFDVLTQYAICQQFVAHSSITISYIEVYWANNAANTGSDIVLDILNLTYQANFSIGTDNQYLATDHLLLRTSGITIAQNTITKIPLSSPITLAAGTYCFALYHSSGNWAAKQSLYPAGSAIHSDYADGFVYQIIMNTMSAVSQYPNNLYFKLYSSATATHVQCNQDGTINIDGDALLTNLDTPQTPGPKQSWWDLLSKSMKSNIQNLIDKVYSIYTSLSSKADLVGGLVPASQLPSYVDDVLELNIVSASAPGSASEGDLYYNTSTLKIYTYTSGLWANPKTPEKGKIYVDISTNITWRWSGTILIAISQLDLGETSSTAYRGDRGKIAYDHSLIIGSNPHGATTDNVSEGSTNLYLTASRVFGTILAGFSAAVTKTTITTVDSILVAFGKVQKYLNDLATIAFSGNATDLNLTNGKAIVGGAGGKGVETDIVVVPFSMGDFTGIYAPFATESNWTNNLMTANAPNGNLNGDFHFGTFENGCSGYVVYSQSGWIRYFRAGGNIILTTTTLGATQRASLVTTNNWQSSGLYTYTSGDTGQIYYEGIYKYECIFNDGTNHVWFRSEYNVGSDVIISDASYFCVFLNAIVSNSSVYSIPAKNKIVSIIAETLDTTGGNFQAGSSVGGSDIIAQFSLSSVANTLKNLTYIQLDTMLSSNTAKDINFTISTATNVKLHIVLQKTLF